MLASMVNLWKSSCRSTVVPSSGIHESSFCTYGSNWSIAETWDFSNWGRRMARECCQNAPSVVKMPLPRKSLRTDWRSFWTPLRVAF